jgi:uncharacterized protein
VNELDEVPACTDCGACCWSPDPRWIAVFEADAARMDARTLALTTVIDGRRHMRMEGRCAALDGTRCTIYPMRPDACRWLERGSSTCRTLIAARRLLRD